MIGLKFEPTVSWGGVVMFTGLLLGGVFAFTDLSARVDLVEQKAGYNAQQTERVAGDLERHKVYSANSDQALRTEIKGELRDISGKLDKLIERELDGRRR